VVRVSEIEGFKQRADDGVEGAVTDAAQVLVVFDEPDHRTGIVDGMKNDNRLCVRRNSATECAARSHRGHTRRPGVAVPQELPDTSSSWAGSSD
jgi:hypothetical protein